MHKTTRSSKPFRKLAYKSSSQSAKGESERESEREARELRDLYDLLPPNRKREANDF